jgi:MoxR-like ATPase
MENLNLKSITDSIISEVGNQIVGKDDLLRKVICSIISGGHILLEDFPGLAKTKMARSFAAALGLEFRRIQFTPDLLPGDITGSYIYNRDTNKFELRKGPIFGGLILADEINRASPKTQSALLEAMQEGQVTIDGDSFKLPDPFIVIATQNPIEYEGTFPLPEAQLDRFALRLSMGYPEHDEEVTILKNRIRRRGEDLDIKQICSIDQLLQIRKALEEIELHNDLLHYIVDIVAASRNRAQVSLGCSPRGSLTLLNLARAAAFQSGRTYAIPDDVKEYIFPVLAHRIILSPELWMRKGAIEGEINAIIQSVKVPVLEDH